MTRHIFLGPWRPSCIEEREREKERVDHSRFCADASRAQVLLLLLDSVPGKGPQPATTPGNRSGKGRLHGVGVHGPCGVLEPRIFQSFLHQIVGACLKICRLIWVKKARDRRSCSAHLLGKYCRLKCQDRCTVNGKAQGHQEEVLERCHFCFKSWLVGNSLKKSKVTLINQCCDGGIFYYFQRIWEKTIRRRVDDELTRKHEEPKKR